DQALLFEGIEIDVADSQRNLYARARHGPLGANVRPLLALRGFLQLRRLLQRQIVKLGNLVDGLQRLLGLIGDFFFGELFVVELNDFLDRAHALAQIIANGNQFLDDDRRARDRAHHYQLPALDALGDRDFAFAREQRNSAHFAQIHAHGIVGFLERTRRQVQVAFAFVQVLLGNTFMVALAGHFHGARRLRRRLIFVNLNAVALERGEEIVDFFRRMDFRRERIVHFVVEQVPALFANGNELAYR